MAQGRSASAVVAAGASGAEASGLAIEHGKPVESVRVLGIDREHVFQGRALVLRVINGAAEPEPGFLITLIGLDDLEEQFAGSFLVSLVERQRALVQQSGQSGIHCSDAPLNLYAFRGVCMRRDAPL